MRDIDLEAPPSGLNVYDILFILYKHKWKVALCAVVGLSAAAACFFMEPPLYQSDAKLLVRYVVDRSAVDPVDGANGSSSRLSEAAIYSETEILTSWDLYEQIAEKVGFERLMPNAKGTATKVGATKAIAEGLSVSAKGGGVIVISYRNTDSVLTVLVLDELLKGYFTKHLEIHRSKAAFDRVSTQNELLRGELTKTEDDLKKKKAEASIISVSEAAAAINSEVASAEHDVNVARIELARQSALVDELEKSYGALGTTSKGTNHAEGGAGHPGASSSEPDKRHASAETLEKYEACLDEITALRKRGIELRSRYIRDTLPVQSNESDLAILERERHELERQYPELLGKVATSGTGATNQDHRGDVSLEKAQLASMKAGMQELDTRLLNIRVRAKEFARIAPEIEQLERDKQLQEANYTRSRSKLENASVDEDLDSSKIPNISTVQKPTPAMRVIATKQKILLGLAGGGIALGVALALLSELVLDQTVKRPLELEKQLQIPTLLSIPHVSRTLALNGHGKNGQLTIAPWDPSHFIRSYSEVLRDRLSLYFELNNMTHRPKLIAVTGFSKGCGVSTLAAGVAAALSETGDGKVLLVDMNAGQAGIHPFFQGKPACNLTAALETDKELASAADNLYLAKGVESENEAAPVRFKRFHDLIPHFKASDFDYIIFDMPPVGQTSPTSGMARFMDKVLFVIESERCNRDLVKRAYTDLVNGRKNVGVVLNNVRSHAPRWIEGDL